MVEMDNRSVPLLDSEIRAFGAVCVFCGSHEGGKPLYAEGARRLGALLAARNLTLVYGGGGIGLMGVLADAVLEAGGRVIGVIPEALAKKEVAHARVQDMRVVESMHDRKALMADLADAFVALPGGLGTLEELFEVLTWAQLGFHKKACGLLNIAGFYDPLLRFLRHAVDDRFMKGSHLEMLQVDVNGEALLDKMASCRLPQVEKWIGKENL
jgi:uncharacterized protein (TIGR00730 family)